MRWGGRGFAAPRGQRSWPLVEDFLYPLPPLFSKIYYNIFLKLLPQNFFPNYPHKYIHIILKPLSSKIASGYFYYTPKGGGGAAKPRPGASEAGPLYPPNSNILSITSTTPSTKYPRTLQTPISQYPTHFPVFYSFPIYMHPTPPQISPPTTTPTMPHRCRG
jgi:hypothetical protein